jgi:hypothetical protein
MDAEIYDDLSCESKLAEKFEQSNASSKISYQRSEIFCPNIRRKNELREKKNTNK